MEWYNAQLTHAQFHPKAFSFLWIAAGNISKAHSLISYLWSYELSVNTRGLRHCQAIEACTTVIYENGGWGWYLMLVYIWTRLVSSAPSVMLSDVVTHPVRSISNFMVSILANISLTISYLKMLWYNDSREDFFPESINNKTENSGPDPIIRNVCRPKREILPANNQALLIGWDWLVWARETYIEISKSD